MKTGQVPQDNVASYGGHKKVVYAVDDSGSYQAVQTSGWEVEGYATQTALDDLDEQMRDCYVRALNGDCSPLAYHMLKARVDLVTLKQITGFWGWQIKRHLKPTVFQRLNSKKFDHYSHVLGIPVSELKTLPEQP